jgi:CoA-dependent NAD(P)H sulfur oxidoreductase
MPYYIGDVIKDYNKLVIRTPEGFQKTGINVKIKSRVEDIDASKGMVYLSDSTSMPYDILVMATGGDAARPDIPGIDLEGIFVMRNLMDTLRLKSYINDKACRKAVIIGGGFIAMEMCEALKNLGIDTTVMIRGCRPVTRWDVEFTDIIIEEIKKKGISFVPETKFLAIEEGTNSRLLLKTDKGDIDADLILLGVGAHHNVKLARAAGVELGESGAIKVDFSQRTSREGIYAVGDCCEVFHRVTQRWAYFPLGDIANKQGRIAGQNIGGAKVEFPGIVGAQSFKVFDLEVGTTGLTEKEAIKYGFQPISALIQGLPVGRPMSKGEKLILKLVADKTTGKLIGGQCVGEKGAIQRIFALSVALWSGLSINEVGYLDFPYAPPFGGAWDAIHVAAQELARKL